MKKILNYLKYFEMSSRNVRCKYFIAGRCRKGTECPFVHEDKRVEQDQRVEQDKRAERVERLRRQKEFSKESELRIKVVVMSHGDAIEWNEPNPRTIYMEITDEITSDVIDDYGHIIFDYGGNYEYKRIVPNCLKKYDTINKRVERPMTPPYGYVHNSDREDGNEIISARIVKIPKYKALLDDFHTEKSRL